MLKKDDLKNVLDGLSKLSEGLSNLKKSLNERSNTMAKTQEELDAELAKAAADEKAAAEAKAAEEAATLAKAAEEKALAEKAEAERLEAEAKAAKNKAEMDELEEKKKAMCTLEETLAATSKKLEEAEAKIQLLTQEAEARLVEASKASQVEAVKAFINGKVASGFATELGLDEMATAIAAEYAYVELVKEFASLVKQVNATKEEQGKAEAFKLAEARYSKLEEAGIAFKGEKSAEQKEKLGKMTEEAFASYETDLKALASSIALNPEEVIRLAKENAGAKSKVTKPQEGKYDKYSKLN